MSDSKNIGAALLAVQQELPTLRKDANNPHFKSKFISLDQLMAAIRPVLSKNGLVWITMPSRDEAGPALAYSLLHAESGEQVQGSMPLMLAKSDPQGQGSALTYARRYSLTAVLGLVADEDDDGHAASQPSRAEQPPRGSSRITPELVESCRVAMHALGWDPPRVATQLTAIGSQDVSDVKAALRSLSQAQGEKLWADIEKAAQEKKAA